MSADFWAGYVSGAVGILIGNPLDILKVQLQRPCTTTTSSPPASPQTTHPPPPPSHPFRFTDLTSLHQSLKGTAAPILGYGALNALMFMTYNRSMTLFSDDPSHPSSLTTTWAAGALAGLATFVVSAPTELIKCRAQVGRQSSIEIAKQIFRERGLRGLYYGGVITSVRDSVGYGFYFWSYELSKRTLSSTSSAQSDSDKPEWMSVLLCGGIAGVVTWASIFPLDVVKTRLQTQHITSISTPPSATANEHSNLIRPSACQPLTSLQIAQQAYRNEGIRVFFRGLGVCSLRAFFVNAVQWAVYEWMMSVLVLQST